MSLISFIEGEEERSELASIQSDRERALRYYQPNKPLGNEIEGRSQVVMRDAFDTVESLMPSLIKVFTSGEDVMSFTPQGPEDVKGAEQETDYVNYLITQKNNGFMVFYDWIKDALLLKNGYVKVSIEKEEKDEDESFEGIDEDTLNLMLKDGGELVAAEPMPTDMGMFYNVTIRKSQEYSCVKLEVLAPDKVRVSGSHRDVSLQEALFVSHEEMFTISQLREMGLDVDDDIDDDRNSAELVDTERLSLDSPRGRDDEGNSADREVRVREVWCRYDEDEDGESELLHVIVCGTTELLKEEAECVPVACISAVRLPHRHDGISIADLVTEIQDIRTTLLRTALDAQYLANHGRNAINQNTVNLDDMLISRPGGVVRVNGSPSTEIVPLVNPVTGAAALQMIEYMDTVRENRTGITKYNQGIDAGSLNKTASGISQIMSASQQRIELMARLIAETGVKELFMLVHKYSLMYMRKPEIVKLRNDWVPINPSEWKERKNMTITVGSASGNKEQQSFQLEKMLQMLAQGMQIGIVTPKNMYNASAKYIQAQGFKNVDDFVSDPEKMPPKPPQEPPELQKAKLEIQADAQKFQAQSQMDQQKMTTDQQMKQQQMQAEMDLKMKQAQMDAELEKYKADLKAQTEKEIAMVKIQAESQIASMREQNDAAQQERNSQRTASQEGQKINLQVDGMDQIKEFQDGAVKEFASHKEEMTGMMKDAIKELTAEIKRPKKIVRDKNGRVAGTE
jgi:hypothetical protein